jgi:hypothetical protein
MLSKQRRDRHCAAHGGCEAIRSVCCLTTSRPTTNSTLIDGLSCCTGWTPRWSCAACVAITGGLWAPASKEASATQRHEQTLGAQCGVPREVGCVGKKHHERPAGRRPQTLCTPGVPRAPRPPASTGYTTPGSDRDATNALGQRGCGSFATTQS